MSNPLFSPVNVPPAVLQVQPTALWPSGRKLGEDRGVACMNVAADPCGRNQVPICYDGCCQDISQYLLAHFVPLAMLDGFADRF